jgi:heme-degrading monooxygenase HmoA
MILELADIRIKPGTQAEFDAAIKKGVDSVVAKAKGFMGYKVNKGIESPERYILMIFWQTLENHTVDFRQSPAFQDWRAIVGPYFAGPPVVEHFTLLAKSA